ncbi:MAG: hypothetical protein HY909_25955 [Deltaproteobacteria bacterium]|nr:hypothetical protein [Deltaproteobacteria bacterium]
MRGLPLVWVLCVSVGCGGRVTRPLATDVPSEAPSGCVGVVRPGEACAPERVVCLAEDRCNDCYCTVGVWVCESRVCGVDASACPAARPSTGSGCATPAAVCDYGLGCTGAHCVCSGGRWTCDLVQCRDN